MGLIIDAHNHAGIRHGAAQTGDDLVKKLDQTGVNKAVIFPFVEGNYSNDVMDEYAKQHPDRLIPYCAVNPWDKEEALQEIERCVKELNFKGLKLHPTIHGYHLADHVLLDPIFDLVEDLEIPIICHGASDLYNSPLEFAEMARAFPKVPLIMAHMGFFWSVEQAISLSKELPNLYLESSRVPIFEVSVAVKELGPEKVIWGTDSPFVDYEWELKKMTRATDSQEGYELIVGGNIQRLLKL